MPFTPEQIIDELYGPPKKEGQKKLEDFRKKNIPKPERTKGETTIIAENKEGKEITYNLEEIKEYWTNFYKNHNLKELAEAIENLDIELTEEQTQRIKELIKENFNKFILLPSPEFQKQYLLNIKAETEKELPGLSKDDQYSPEGTYLSSTVKPNFPNNLVTLNRPDKPYLLFLKDTKEVDKDTLNKSPEQLRETLKQQNLNGLTLPEYLLFQRNYTETNKEHPDTKNWTWLLDQESPQSDGPVHVLGAYWSPYNTQVVVYSYPSGVSDSGRGGRSSAIFEI